jgi:hypothetical protein
MCIFDSSRQNPTAEVILQTYASFTPITGAFFLMRGANTAIVDRTWGLHEVQARQRDKAPEHLRRLAYGPNFVYDEFFITNNAFYSLLIGIATAVITFCLLMPPVSRLVFPFFIQCADFSSRPEH